MWLQRKKNWVSQDWEEQRCPGPREMAELGSDDSEGFTGPQPGKCHMDLDSQTAEVPSLEPQVTVV